MSGENDVTITTSANTLTLKKSNADNILLRLSDDSAKNIIAIGTDASGNPNAEGGISIGYNSYIDANNNVAIGTNSKCKAGNSVAIGNNAESNQQSVAIGHDCSGGFCGTSIGSGAKSGNLSASYGLNTQATGEKCVAISGDALANNTVAVGYDAYCNGVNSMALGYNAGTGDYTNSIALGANSSVGANDVIVLGDGTQKVGIGTTSPQHVLDVNGGIKVEGTGTNPGLTMDNVLYIQRATNTNGVSYSSYDFHSFYSNSTSNAESGGERMRISSNGNVGIGTNNPTYKLQVDGNFLFTGSDCRIKLNNSGNTTHFSFGGNGDHYIRSNSGNGKVILQDTGGNVGIRTSGPRCPLDVKGVTYNNVDVDDTNDGYNFTWHGASKFQNNTYQNVSICADDGVMVSHGFLAGYGISFASDERIKTNIIDINDDNALQTLRLIQPKIYNYKEPIISGRSREPVYGFIAQQIAEVLPHAVDIGNINGSNIDFMPNILSLCKITIEDGNQILELVNSLDINNILTNDTNSLSYNVVELNKYTSDFERDAEENISTTMFIDKNNNKLEYSIKNVISNTKFSLNEIIDSDVIYTNNTILLYGQKVKDFHNLNKDYIFTVATAALQEVDRQLQAEKAKTATLEAQVADLLIRVSSLENV